MNYLFENEKGHVNLVDLNRGYGCMGQTFKTKKEAELHKRTLKSAYITRLVEYKNFDLRQTDNLGTHAEGAKPKVIAWLVTNTQETKEDIGRRYE